MSVTINKEIQNLELNILEYVIQVCAKHNLRYYVIGGSLIGVLRHKGFIPWDDDIDVGMPRDDYEKFIQICKAEKGSKYKILDNNLDPSWFFNFVQIVDTNIDIDIYMTEEPRRCHPWVDLFPLDGLPSNKFCRKAHFKKVLFYRYLIQIANIEQQVDTHKVGRPAYESLALKLFKTFRIGQFINCRTILRKMNKALKKYNYDNSDYVGNLLGKYRDREIVPKAYFGTATQLPFESIQVNVPEKYHQLQTHLYGNYMELPPEDKRVNHDIIIVNK